MIERPVLHNCHLPNWLHRICNAGFGSLLIATLGTLAVSNLLPNALQSIGMGVVIAGTVVTGLVLLILDPIGDCYPYKHYRFVDALIRDVGAMVDGQNGSRVPLPAN